MMTVEQYKEWIRTRGEPGTWDLTACCAADALIRRETLKNAAHIIRTTVPHKPSAEYIILMLVATFGSVETDAYLMSIKAYPDWIN